MVEKVDWEDVYWLDNGRERMKKKRNVNLNFHPSDVQVADSQWMLGVGTKSRLSINNAVTGLQGDYHLSLMCRY